MKLFSWTLVIVGIALAIWMIIGAVIAGYQYENDYYYAWSLADKSSDLQSKSKYITEFRTNLEIGYMRGDFASYDVLFLKTNDNSFERNLEALKSLEKRIIEIQLMDVKSFEYNTAIQQITSQEQGEAQPMLKNFKNCYLFASYPYLWRIFLVLSILLIGAVICFGAFIIMEY